MTLHRTVSNQICAAIVLSIVLMTHGALIARQDLDELLGRANENTLYSELRKYHRTQPNFLAQWPGLRDLLVTADYDDNFLDNDDAVNSRLLQRLNQLSANTIDTEDARADNYAIPEMVPENTPTSRPLKKFIPSVANSRMIFKDHGVKKNIQLRKQYMSPCHFKICNMGRKRSARFYGDDN